LNKSIQIVSNQSIKCPDDKANICIPGGVMQKSIGVVGNLEAFNTYFAPQLAGMHGHAQGTKQMFLTAAEHE